MNHNRVATPLKERIRRGDHLLGLLVRTPSIMLIEMAGNNGYDFVLLDTEHGVADQKDLAEHVVAARAAEIPILVRIGEQEKALALRALDAGAEGIVVPHVQTAAAAEAAVRMAHYPPRGTRGFATYTAAGRWGKVGAKEHVALAAAHTLVIAMIEDSAGVENADGISDTPGIDVVWVGPADLSASLGYDPAAADAGRRRVWSAARAKGTPVLAIVTGIEEARSARAQGAQLVMLNTQAAIDRCLSEWADAF